MTYQTAFVSSEIEEKKRRVLLSGSRRFSFLGHEFYYSYSPSIQKLKERIVIGLYQMDKALNDLGQTVKQEYMHSCLMGEIACSCSLDGYPYSRRLEWLYLKNKPMIIGCRTKPIKNLSLMVGFSPSSPCKNARDIDIALVRLRELESQLSNEDSLIWTLIKHFMFEYIHPYQLMNGMIGRYEIYKSLKGTPYEFLGMRFAASFINDKKTYFLSFKRSESSFDLNEYLEPILSCISKEIEKDLQDLREKAKRWELCIRNLDAYGFNSGKQATAKGILMMKIFGRHKLNLSRLANVLRKSERSVFRHASSMKDLDFDKFDTPK